MAQNWGHLTLLKDKTGQCHIISLKVLFICCWKTGVKKCKNCPTENELDSFVDMIYLLFNYVLEYYYCLKVAEEYAEEYLPIHWS